MTGGWAWDRVGTFCVQVPSYLVISSPSLYLPASYLPTLSLLLSTRTFPSCVVLYLCDLENDRATDPTYYLPLPILSLPPSLAASYPSLLVRILTYRHCGMVGDGHGMVAWHGMARAELLLEMMMMTGRNDRGRHEQWHGDKAKQGIQGVT